MNLKTDAVPSSEFSETFLQGMVDRMGMSFYKYGALAKGFPDKVDALASMEARVGRYLQTGNTEFLIDAANFLMIEFMRPRHKGAHYRPTDSRESPGRVWNGEVNGVSDRNVPDRED